MTQTYKTTNQNNPIIHLILLLLLVGGVSLSGWGQYEGTGTFQQITTLEELESGTYYVFYGINGPDNGAMTNTISSGRLGNTAVTITGAGIIDPAESIVWLVEGNAEDGYTVYNEDADVYSEITDNSTRGFALNSSSSHTYAVSVNDDEYTFVSNHSSANNRAISIYQTDWRPYANPNTLHLYKLTEIEDPLLIAAPTSLSGFDYTLDEGPSEPQSFSLSGTNLDETDVTVAAPADFVISKTEVGGYGPTVTLEDFDGSPTDIWVQLAVGLEVDAYSGDITINGGGADEVTVAVSGNVWPDYDYIEGFDNFPVTSGSYATDEETGFSGVAGNTWYYIDARGDININDETVTLQNNTAAKLYSSISGGITEFSFDYMQAFGTNVHLEVHINGSLVATVTSDGEQNIVKNSGNISAADVQGTFTIEFKQGTSPTGGQVAIDNFSWKKALDNPVLSLDAGTYFEDQTVFISNFEDYDESVTIYYTLDGEDPDGDDTEYNNTTGILLEDGNGPITLKAIAIDGEVESGITTAEFIFPEDVANIAAFREGDNGTLYRITGEVVVLHRNSYRNRHFVRDGSGSLTIWDDNEPNIISTNYDVGDGVTDFTGYKREESNGAVIVLDAATDPGPKSDEGLDVSPLVITIEELDLDYTGNLVTIKSVIFSVIGSFANSQSYSFSDPSEGGTISFRTDFFGMDYIGDNIPEDPINLTAIVGGFGSNPQVTARNWADFAFLSLDDGNWPVLPEEASFLINHNITLEGSASVANLTISDGQTLTIAPVGTLTVTGTLTNENNGAKNGTGLLIQSDASGTGSLIHNSDDVPATVERYFATGETWRLVSSPVVNHEIIDLNNWTPSGTYPGGHGYDFFAYDEENEFWRNQKVGENGITHFVPGKGYLVSFQSQPYTPYFAHNLNNGNVTIAVTKHSSEDFAGANLIGNPYASGIDWFLAEKALFEDDFAYVYDASANGGSGAYIMVDGGAADAFIAPHQGFFVIKDDAGSGDFTFTNAMRVHGGTFTKQQQIEETLVLRLSGDPYFDQTTLRIHEGSDFVRDRQDARKFFSYNPQAPQVYSFTSDHVQVSINSIPKIDEDRQIRLGVLIPEDGEYTLSLQAVSGAFESSTLLLEDAYKDIFHDLHEQPIYAFEAEEGDISERFTLHFSPPDDEDITNISETGAPEARIWQHNNILHVDNPDTDLNLHLYDISGRRLQHFDAPAGQHQFELNLPAGAYFVKSSGKNQHETIKIIIQ